jgi:uncharacterized membrane protein YebE (DUF533 family)
MFNSKRICAMVLGLVLMSAVTTTANAQSFGGRLSNGEKAGAIGGGAAAGALIGGLLGGKKGAVIGGLLGGGAGTAYVYSQGRDYDRYDRSYGYRNYPNYRDSRDWRYRSFQDRSFRYDNSWDRDRNHNRDRDRWRH